jgi:hypothetical protein
VQVDPLKPALKPPGIKRLKIKYCDPLENFAFKFNLRRYIMEGMMAPKTHPSWLLWNSLRFSPFMVQPGSKTFSKYDKSA